MPSYCAVATCNDRYSHSENISFHKFPLKRLNLLKQWEAFIQKQRGESWHASRWSSLCSRHFREEDFRSLNERRTLKKTAVPSILGDNTPGKPQIKENAKDIEICESTRDKEFKEILAIKERLEDTIVEPNVPKTNCRLCGVASVAAANFLTNYELYGLLQKCFPTLNIQQEDTLPKVMCAPCQKSLEDFGSFVDRVWTAQTELQRKFRSRAVEKPVKIKQEPLVRVKQEVAESGYDEGQETNGFAGTNEDYDGALEGGVHEDGGDDQKFEFCDFPIINDCDIMEIINLDDPFINIPDDDNTTTVNEEEEVLQKPIHDPAISYMPTAHELLQCHLLMEEHNYAYIDAEAEFKEERQIYKTEKSDNDERLMEYVATQGKEQQQLSLPISYSIETRLQPEQQFNVTNHSENTAGFEKRALKPIVTSVSAIQQPITSKPSSNGIVVLNESIVKSGCGFQLHACMVCQLKFFSVESLKQHYTQTHGTPMVTVPGVNIPLERVSQNTCKMEKEFPEVNSESCEKLEVTNQKVIDFQTENNGEGPEAENNFQETKQEKPDNFSDKQELEQQNHTDIDKISTQVTNTTINTNEQIAKSYSQSKSKQNLLNKKSKKQILKIPLKSRKSQNVYLNAMANQYQQLRKLYQKLQKKCTNLELNVEQLQLLPTPPSSVTKITNKRPRTKVNTKRSKTTKVKLKSKEAADNEISLKRLSFTCTECPKTFSNGNCLRQHKITHTEERKHHCTLCQRSFKRRNGLLQHLKGFHLKVKPFCCPVCKHCYALKCDMLRCKHSVLRNLEMHAEKSNISVNKSGILLKSLEKYKVDSYSIVKAQL